MLELLKERILKANLELPKQGLVKYTWGNVSGVDREKKLFVIKPSGISYDTLKASDMIVCNFDGQVVEGNLSPSSDTMTHAVLYKNFKEIGGIVHTHSQWATAWAQAGLDVPAMGTTHADTFYGSVPCTRFITQKEIENGYEKETGNIIVETFHERNLKPLEIPGVLLHGHAPFTWGKTADDAVINAVVLDEVCKINFYTRQLNSYATELPQSILDKHYLRKHGENSYYGQK